MTQKELLYLEDAVGHESNIIKIIEDTISKLDDKKLIDFMNSQLINHQNLKQKLIDFMEDKINE